MVYGSVSTGFNAGQYNTGNAAAPAVQPEKLTAYEVGTKTNWLDGRLQANLSAYWYSFKDLQVAVTEQAVTVQTNAAAARIKGVEFSMEAQPFRDLHFQGGFSYNDAVYTDYNNVQFYVPAVGGGYMTVVGNAAGKYLVASPKVSATAAADYDLHTAIGTFATSLSFSHKGRIYWDYSNTISTGSIDLLNAELKWHPSFSDKWDVILWGKNLTDKQYNQLEGVRLELASAVPGAPRTYGVTFEARY
jgi:iron complex outermembrane receptor protein